MFSWFRKSKKLQPARALPFNAGLFDGESAPLYTALAAYWAKSDPAFVHQQGAIIDVEALERRYSLTLPEDFRSYLLHAAPTTIWMDDIGTQWWSAPEIKSLPDECPDGSPGNTNPDIEQERDQCLVFADYLIWCYAWAICCSDGPNRGKIALIGGSPDMFVADSFRDFLRLELVDAIEIHGGPSKKRSA
ncbi:SMI1/KNR4 family protein [Sphingobium sp. H39-3-25]|uniref:SMI1/KNR4 family protein n=1 Tax=Sphingobium arseniciresistens TaxID=3030834 RepID=UPI0023BA0509|nr:SMI1/KNR4 family protein [Sphingobium arseniciresistens]